VRFVPLDEGVKSGLHPALQMDACRRLMHVVSPDHRVLVGWDAVTGLARLFPWTWIVGVIGGIGPFRWLGRHVYRWVADHRYGISRVMRRFTGVKRTGPKCKLGPP
jgi:predicted DCC family thiol-disulfide oxidoreductase YuxK